MKRQSHHNLRLLALLAVTACLMAVGAYAAETGIITGEVVNVRKGPGTGYERVEMLAAGKKVTVLGSENGWYHISWNNSEGYVLGDYLALSGAGAAAQAEANATVTGGGTINVRSGPGTEYSRIAMVGSGKRVAMLDQSGGWYHISFDGKTGYILGDYLIVDGAAPEAEPNATVTGGGTINVRSGPGTSYSRVSMVGTGKRVAVLDQSGGWYHISFDGQSGYILSDYLIPDGSPAAGPAALPAEEPAPVSVAEAQLVGGAPEHDGAADMGGGVIVGGTINVRSGPGTEYDRITMVGTGKKVTILGEENGWYRVSFDGSVGYVLSDYLVEGDDLPASGVGGQVAMMARQYLGTRYVYGGASPSGFDCSGFALYLYKQFGYSLPHTASGQYANCGYKVSKAELQPGDLVFFTSPGNGGRIDHVGIYLGDGQVIHARYSIGKVHVNALSESYYAKNYVGAVRIA